MSEQTEQLTSDIIHTGWTTHIIHTGWIAHKAHPHRMSTQHCKTQEKLEDTQLSNHTQWNFLIVMPQGASDTKLRRKHGWTFIGNAEHHVFHWITARDAEQQSYCTQQNFSDRVPHSDQYSVPVVKTWMILHHLQYTQYRFFYTTSSVTTQRSTSYTWSHDVDVWIVNFVVVCNM